MTNAQEPRTPTIAAQIEALAERATPGEWQLQDGCSWRRIGTHFHDGDVLCPTNARTDGHPDLIANDGRLYDNLKLICLLKNNLPAIVTALRQAEAAPHEWPDIGPDPLKTERPADRYEASRLAVREAYVKQQPHVPDQTALVWRWHIGALLEMALRLQTLLKRDEPAQAEAAPIGMLRQSAEKHAAVCGDLADKTPIAGEPDPLWWQRQSALREASVILAHLAREQAEAPPAADTAMVEAAKPWADYHGDLPDYDHPFRCIFESGIQYAVELLAKELGVTDFTPCDGTEEFDGDLGGTLINIVAAAGSTDEHGDYVPPRELRAALDLASRQPVGVPE